MSILIDVLLVSVGALIGMFVMVLAAAARYSDDQDRIDALQTEVEHQQESIILLALERDTLRNRLDREEQS